MEGWRLIAGALVAVSGIVLMLLVMARVRERRDSRGADVAVAGSISLVILVILVALILLVLPSTAVWTIVVLVAGWVTVMLLAS